MTFEPVHKFKNIKKICGEMKLFLSHEKADACYQISVNAETGTLIGKMHFSRGETIYCDKNIILVGFFKKPLSMNEIEDAALEKIFVFDWKKRTGKTDEEIRTLLKKITSSIIKTD